MSAFESRPLRVRFRAAATSGCRVEFFPKLAESARATAAAVFSGLSAAAVPSGSPSGFGFGFSPRLSPRALRLRVKYTASLYSHNRTLRFSATMSFAKPFLAILLSFAIALPGFAQTPELSGGTHNFFSWITDNYVGHPLPRASFEDSPRLEKLMRAGAIYLSLRDAIALALENNLDLEFARYNPKLAQANLQRASAGELLRNVSTSITSGPSSATLGVLGGSALGSAGTTSSSSSGSGQAACSAASTSSWPDPPFPTSIRFSSSAARSTTTPPSRPPPTSPAPTSWCPSTRPRSTASSRGS